MLPFSTRFVLLRNPAVLKAGLGFLICTLASIVITFLLRKSDAPDTIPILFLVVVGLVAWFLGSWAAALGLFGSSLVFALFLFPPLGRLAVRAEAARTNLLMMLLFGIAVAYFYGDRTGSGED
jgi:K+-sensing histidine kinase KdpD